MKGEADIKILCMRFPGNEFILQYPTVVLKRCINTEYVRIFLNQEVQHEYIQLFVLMAQRTDLRRS